jgi:UDP-N-acetylmuramyl-tripeptide synthetase
MHTLTSPEQASQWLRARVTGALHTDSRKVTAGDGFIAWPGAATDGRQYVQSALDAGAAVCLVEDQGVATFGFKDARVVGYSSLKAATGLIAAHYYGHPSHSIDLVAITGTNGKTSTAWWLAQALNTLQYRRDAMVDSALKSKGYCCGLVGTLGIGTPGQMVFNGLTTPDPVLLQAEFAQMLALGVSACAIEASSIGLAEHRLSGSAIHTAVFTNFTQDHLDYHETMAEYWESKLSLFNWPDLKSAVVNLDDSRGTELMQLCAARGVKVWTVSQVRTDASVWAQAVQYTDSGMSFRVCEGGQSAIVDCAVIGEYNVSNLLGVIAALRSLGVELNSACKAVSASTAVPGRMECVTLPHAPMVAVDYAHTPDALDKVLAALRPTAHARGGHIWCVFGCGGDRDASKRPLMAVAAQQGAHHVVVTSDNPRSEAPEAIIAQIVAGISASNQLKIQSDRALAIQETIQLADARDVVLLAGKGHEDYQEIAGKKYPFSDLVQAKSALKKRMQGVAA